MRARLVVAVMLEAVDVASLMVLIRPIGRTAPLNASNPWITRCTFPGGGVPALSEVAEAVQNGRLRIGGIESLRLHSAMRLRCCFERCSAKADVAAALKDERFVRMWLNYLAASEQTVRHGPQDVFQFDLCRRPDTVPITRDYFYAFAGQKLARAAK